MNKLKFYQFLTVALLIGNLVLLSFLFFGKKKNGRGLSPKKIVSERLNLTKSQQAEYEKLIKNHQQDIGAESQKIAELKNNLYATLSADTQSVVLTDSLLSLIAIQKLTIEKIHYAHFLDIKKLCTPEQLPAFEALSQDIAKIFSPPRKRRRHKKP